MAFSQINRLDGANLIRVDIEATDDADGGAVVIQHGFNTINVDVKLTPLLTAYYASTWTVAGFNSNQVFLFKFAGAGSGAVGGQARVLIRRPHSLFL
jgi:hypothetical protein